MSGKSKDDLAQDVKNNHDSEHYTTNNHLITEESDPKLGSDADDDEHDEYAETEENSLQDSDGHDSAQLKDTIQLARASTKLTKLPALLPAEYLEDDDMHAPTPLLIEVPRQKTKKTKFHDVVVKKPKDRKKGTTIYRVGESQNTRLAPRFSVQAKSTKESWLQGRSGKRLGSGSNRKPLNAGFFK